MGDPLAAPVFADLSLARRLERTEAQGNLDFVEARARVFPDSRAQWIEVAGAHALFDGVDSPLTQTFGLGMRQEVTAAAMERIESFFAGLGAPVFHEVSPLADPSALCLLNERGYEPFEFTSVMFMELSRKPPEAPSPPTAVKARVARGDEIEVWAGTFLRGWNDTPGMGEFMSTFARVSARKASGVPFLGERDGAAIAAGSLTIHEGVALLAGASTVPEARRQGAQTALLEARLRFAQEKGCDVAMICALPGSTSQKNAERQGFKIAYTRIKWRKKSGKL